MNFPYQSALSLQAQDSNQDGHSREQNSAKAPVRDEERPLDYAPDLHRLACILLSFWRWVPVH